MPAANRACRVLSLRLVISAASIFLVVLVAGISLGSTIQTSLDSIRRVGSGRALALLDGIESRTLSMFEADFRAASAIDTAVRSRQLALPSEDPAVLESVLLPVVEFASRSVDLDTVMFIITRDFARFIAERSNMTHHGIEVMLPAYAPNSTSVQTVSRFTVEYPTSPDTNPGTVQRSAVSSVAGIPAFVAASAAGLETLLQQTNNGTQRAMTGGIVRYVPTGFAGRVEAYVSFAVPLTLHGVPRSRATMYGAVGVSITTKRISGFLRSARGTPNTAAFAIDGDGYLVGSSGVEAISETSEVAPGTVPSAGGCATTEETSPPGPSGNFYIVCRKHFRDLGHAALAQAPVGVIQRDDAGVTVVDVDGERVYAASQRVDLGVAGYRLQLLLFMPEEDVIGDIVTSRNTGIAFVASLVVLAAAVTFAIVFVLLSPLSGIATRMRRAADLDDDDEDASVSAMAEVAELQEAYYAMNDELNRIRAFVPQSVLMAKKEASPTAACDVMSDIDEDLNLSLGASGSARSSGNNRGGISPTNGSSDNATSRRRRASVPDPASSDAESTRTSAADRHASAPRPGVSMGDYHLKPATVSVLVANTNGFGVALAGASRQGGIDRVVQLVELVHDAVVGAGGVLASYHGDHFVATFNAAKVCATHASAACTAALAIRDKAASTGFKRSVRLGVATSRCLVGTLGCKHVKAFSTVGAAFQQASALERLCRLYTADVAESAALLSWRTSHEVGSDFRARAVDMVRLPGSAAPAPVMLLHSVADDGSSESQQRAGGAAGGGGGDEWLYVVAAVDASNPFKVWNAAFDKLADGDVAAAKDFFDAAVEQGAQCTPSEAARIKLLCSPPGEASEEEHRQKPHTDLGLFYELGVLGRLTGASPSASHQH